MIPTKVAVNMDTRWMIECHDLIVFEFIFVIRISSGHFPRYHMPHVACVEFFRCNLMRYHVLFSCCILQVYMRTY